ncbi:MAG: hypothetical protein ACYCXA_07675 [Actinomycetes bacterium]
MAVEVHVTGRIQAGRFAEFLEAAERWRAYRGERGWALPRVLSGLSGEMNSVRLVFAYPDLGVFEREDAEESGDRDYAAVAMGMPFEGPIVYTLYRDALPPQA